MDPGALPWLTGKVAIGLARSAVGAGRSTSAKRANGALVAAPVHFAAQRAGAAMALDGVDLLRVEGDRIAEVWLFSADQQAEDSF